MRQPIQVLVYPVKITYGEQTYLLLRRTANRDGFWQGVTGGVEEEEDLPDTAKRELVEETGLTPLAIERIDYAYSFPVADRWRHLYAEGVEEIMEHVFVAHIDDGQEPLIDTREHDRWEWCGLNRALELLTWSENIEALQRCDNFLKGRSRLE